MCLICYYFKIIHGFSCLELEYINCIGKRYNKDAISIIYSGNTDQHIKHIRHEDLYPMRSLEVIYLFACMIDRLGRPIVPYIVRGIGLQGPDPFTYKFLSSLHKNTVTIQSYLLGVGVSIYLIGCLYSISGKTLFNGCRETVRTGSRWPPPPLQLAATPAPPRPH